MAQLCTVYWRDDGELLRVVNLCTGTKKKKTEEVRSDVFLSTGMKKRNKKLLV